MEQFIKIIVLSIFLLVAVLALVTWMVAPGKYTKEMAKPFKNRYFAHRGLHNISKGIPENSIAAFSAACDAGYGIELDLQLTADNQVVVFHDFDLIRVCEDNKSIENYTAEELSQFRLLGTEEKIPLFSDVLEIVAGRIPLVIEIKPGKMGPSLCEKTLALLADYDGDYCIESFDPIVVRWLKQNAPHIFRGQLANRIGSYDKKYPWIGRLAVSRCIFNFLTKPHFIAYESGKKPWPIKLTKALGATHYVWTSLPKEKGGRPEADARENDVVIFEGYTPPLTLKP